MMNETTMVSSTACPKTDAIGTDWSIVVVRKGSALFSSPKLLHGRRQRKSCVRGPRPTVQFGQIQVRQLLDGVLGHRTFASRI